MENTMSIPTREKVSISVDDVKSGDIIYLSNKQDAVPYNVLDVGKPFILIENLRNHFCNLYRATTIYKEI